MDGLIKKPKQKSEKYLRLYKQYKADFDEYFNNYKLFYEKISYIQLEYTPKCANCYHCKKNKPQYGTGYICWQGWTGGLPKKVNLNSSCKEHQPKYDEPTTIYLLNNNFETVKTRILSYSHASHIQTNWERKEISLEEKSIRAAYDWCDPQNKIHSVVSPCFNRPTLTRILIDCFNQNIKQIQIGKDALKYESSIGEIITRSNITILPNIFKIKYSDLNYFKFKRMDFHIKINSTHYILEVFTCRSYDEKIRQVQDYVYLLKKCFGNLKVKPLLIEKFSPFNQEIEGQNVCGIPILNEKNLVNFLYGGSNGDFV